MHLLLVILTAILSGGLIGRWWALGAPIVLGACMVVLFALSGELANSPVVFVILVAELGTAVGVLLRQRFVAIRTGS